VGLCEGKGVDVGVIFGDGVGVVVVGLNFNPQTQKVVKLPGPNPKRK
jgi:hypothetical protein